MYKIKLPNFEGPFDLLLYLINREELNIYDIPIARITQEFLNYTRIMQILDLELAGEFLVMAANLMFIKSQLLLPRDENEETGELDDPRTELVHRLIEYKQFKEASRNLSMYEGENRYVYYRSIFEGENQLIYESTQNIYKNATIFDLLKAFQKALNRTKPVVTQHLVTLFPVTIEEKTNLIISELNAKNRILFLI